MFPMFHDIQYDADFFEDPLEKLLPLLGGICWTIVYLIIICYSCAHRDKVYIPIMAFSMNFVWEFIYSFIIPVPSEQRIIDLIWFVLDCIIFVFTWRNYFFINSGRQPFFQTLLYLFSQLVIGVYFNWLFIEVIYVSCAFYSAFVINMVMSYLFITSDQETPNVCIAFFKMLGTTLTSVYGYLFLVQTDFMIVTYLGIFALDIIYLFQCLFSLWKGRRAACVPVPVAFVELGALPPKVVPN